MWRHIPPYQSGLARGKINTNQWFFKRSCLTSLRLTSSFLIGHMEVRHSLLYHELLPLLGTLNIRWCIQKQGNIVLGSLKIFTWKQKCLHFLVWQEFRFQDTDVLNVCQEICIVKSEIILSQGLKFNCKYFCFYLYTLAICIIHG